MNICLEISVCVCVCRYVKRKNVSRHYPSSSNAVDDGAAVVEDVRAGVCRLQSSSQKLLESAD
jgi:hypothetical protein